MELKYSVRLSRHFICEGLLIFKFNFFKKYKDIRIFYLLLSKFLIMCAFQRLCPLNLDIKLIGITLFMMFPCNHLNVLL